MSQSTPQPARPNALTRLLDTIEWLGNLLPHPVTLFALLAPMMSYFGMILAVAGRYQKNLGLGTLIATMLPYSVLFLIGWSLLFYLWVFVFGLPVGPGAATYYP